MDAPTDPLKDLVKVPEQVCKTPPLGRLRKHAGDTSSPLRSAAKCGRGQRAVAVGWVEGFGVVTEHVET